MTILALADAPPALDQPIPFIDLQAQRRRISARIDGAIRRVLDHGRFILGPEIAELESRLAARARVGHCITCANGTDALALVLMAWGLRPGDAVFVPAFTFVATAEVVAWLGATPVFVDVAADSFNLDPASLEAAVALALELGLRPRAVIPVDLFGQPADYAALLPQARRHGLAVLADAAQSFGAQLDGAPVGSFGDAAATSFFPAKPLGCYGDGGAIFTADAALAEVLRSLRTHGQGAQRYDHPRVGLNGRLDTIQAAILLEKLTIFDDEIAARNRIAAAYSAALGGLCDTPELRPGAASVWAQYTLRTPHRDALAAAAAAAEVPTAIYYPTPLSHQPAYAKYPCAPGGVPVSEALSRTVISLPMHAYLEPAVQSRIIDVVAGVLTRFA